MRVRMESLFGVADFYSGNLRKLGHEAWDIHANNEFAQKAWAREHGVQLPSDWSWQFRLRRRPRPIRWGSLRRLRSISNVFGFDRGQPIDRYYIEGFLTANASDIRGHVLEIGDDAYTQKFGRKRVTKSDVLHAVKGNPQATLVGDLATGKGIPEAAFDCMILTQTFHCIYDLKSAIANSYRALKPGGVLLATFPGISQISRYDMDRWGTIGGSQPCRLGECLRRSFRWNMFRSRPMEMCLWQPHFCMGLRLKNSARKNWRSSPV